MIDIVFHLTKCAEGSMVASARIARFISAELDIPLIHTVEQLDELMSDVEFEGLNRFILVNSPSGFAPAIMRDICGELSYIAKDAIFVQNDYKIHAPSQCKSIPQKMFGEYKGESPHYGLRLWSTVPKMWDIDTTYINWNRLTYTPSELSDTPFNNRTPGVLYWGALRKGREERLSKLLTGINTIISTSPQSVIKFQKYLPDATYVKPFKKLHESLCCYQATLYTQDEKSDTLYCSLANRFYEALSAGVAILIDGSAENTFKESGLIGYEKYIVKSPDDIEWLLDEAEEIAAEQRELWCRDYMGDLINELHNLK